MATSRKALREALRADYLAKVIDLFTNAGEEVLRTGSQEIAMPCVDAEGNDDFIVITVKVPTGERGENGAAYDGYSMAEEYAMKVADKAAKVQGQDGARCVARFADEHAEGLFKRESRVEEDAEGVVEGGSFGG